MFSISLPSRLATICLACRMNERAEQNGAAQHVIRIAAGTGRHGIGAHDIDEALEPGNEIGPLDLAEFLGGKMAAERLQLFAGAAGEDEDRRAQGMGYLAVQKGAVLHGHQEMAQPAEALPFEGGVEFVEEDQRDLSGEPQCRAPGAGRGAGLPPPVNWETLNSSFLMSSGNSELATSLIPKDFPEPGEPKTAIDSGLLCRLLLQYSATRERMPRKLSISRRSAVSKAAEFAQRHIAQHGFRALEDDAPGGLFQVFGVAVLEDRPETGSRAAVSGWGRRVLAGAGPGPGLRHASRDAGFRPAPPRPRPREKPGAARPFSEPRSPYPSWCRRRMASMPDWTPCSMSGFSGARSSWRTMPAARQEL